MLALRRFAVVVLALNVTAVDAADKTAKDPATIEYVVQFVHLRSAQPIEPKYDGINMAPLKGAALEEALAKWKEAGVLKRTTTARLSSPEGMPISMEMDDLHVGSSGGKLRASDLFQDPPREPKIRKHVEHKAFKISLNGRIADDKIVVSHSAEESHIFELLPAAVKVPATPPERTTSQTTVSLTSGETTVLGGVTTKSRFAGDDDKSYEVKLHILTASIRPPKQAH